LGGGRNNMAQKRDHLAIDGCQARPHPFANYSIFVHLSHRVVGSSRSRNPSPSKFSPTTTIMIAAPGKTASHQADCKYVWASFNISHHSGVGGWAPRPTKLSPAAVRIARPTLRVTSTIIGVSTLRSTWDTMIRQWGAPSARAAST